MDQSLSQVAVVQGDVEADPLNPQSDAPTLANGDAQRHSLRDLAVLAAQCAESQRQIEQEYEAAVSALEMERQRSDELLSQQAAEDRQAIEAEYGVDLEALRNQAEDRQRALQADEAKIKGQWKARHEQLERSVRHQYEQEKWLADGELEADQIRIKGEAVSARKTLDEQNAALDQLASDAGGLMLKYGLTQVPAVSIAADGAPGSMAQAADFEKARQEMELRLRRLRYLIVPRLFVGVTPYLVVLLWCIAAAGVGQWGWGRTPLPPLSQFKVDWRIMGFAIAGALVVSLLAGIGLRLFSQSRLRKGYAGFLGAMAQARQAQKQHRRMVDEAEQNQKGASEQKHRRELDQLRGKYYPAMEQARHKRDTALADAHSEYERLANESRREDGEKDATLRRRYDDSLAALESRRKDQRESLRQKHEAERAAIERDHAGRRRALQERLTAGLARIQTPAEDAAPGMGRAVELDGVASAWRDWKPPTVFSSQFRFGSLRVDLPGIARVAGALDDTAAHGGTPDSVHSLQLTLPEPFDAPAFLTIPQHASLLVRHDPSGRHQAIRTLQVAMLRLLTGLPPGRVRFTLIDPVGLGQNFAGFMHLADYEEALVGGRIWTEPSQIDQRLADLTEHMETVIQKYLRNEYATIDDYNRQAGELAEPYRFLVIADFPTGFSEEALHRLASISASGARCGVHTLIASDRRQALSQSLLDDLAARSVHLAEWVAPPRQAMHRESVSDEPSQHQQGVSPAVSSRPELPEDPALRFVWKDEVYGQFPLTLDLPPDEILLTPLMERIGRAAQQARRVEEPFSSIAPEEGRLWSLNSRQELSVPIGRSGATRQQMLRLGRGVAQHGLIAGKTGSGKSTLLHVMISSIALWYPPDEVEMYLIDFKRGVEFKTYATHTLPHVRAVAVESDREFGLSVLQRLDAELGRRGEIFRKAGVQDLPSYRSRHAEPMPRVLLVIDEFQEFFTEEDRLAQEAALILDRLVRQGRAFGIHLMLGSQTLSGASGLARSTLGQMAVRIALQTSEADSQLILGDDNTAARLLDRPGEAIYNDAGGLVESNSPFQVAWLDDAQREHQLARVDETARRRGIELRRPIIFEGGAPASLAENHALADLLTHQPTVQPAAPLAYLGDPVAIKAPTAVPMRAVSGKNLLMIGQQPEAALATLMASAISLSAQHGRSDAQFILLDATPVDSPLAGRLETLAEILRQETRVVAWRDTGQAINDLAAMLQDRQENPDRQHPAIYLLLYGLQRYRLLRRSEESFSFSAEPQEKSADPAAQFVELLREGPALGIHTLCWCDTPAALERTLDRAMLREFDHRILFQVSANDSSNLVDSPAANNLGLHRALAYSEEQGTLEKFRPYAMPDAGWLEQVKQRLSGG